MTGVIGFQTNHDCIQAYRALYLYVNITDGIRFDGRG